MSLKDIIKLILKILYTIILAFFNLVFLLGMLFEKEKIFFLIFLIITSLTLFLMWYKKGKPFKHTYIDNENNKNHGISNDKFNTLYEIQNLIKSLSPKCNYKKLATHLRDVLSETESIEAVTHGTQLANDYKHALSCVVTNKRFIGYHKTIFNEKRIEIPIEKISSIIYSTGIIKGTIEINNMGHKLNIYNVPKSEVQDFVKSVNEQINNYKTFKIEYSSNKQANVADQIEKLAGLYKDGVLTEFEFQIKKKELLK
ncbi:MAG: PH domain-containing protein [Clostridia bacterium]|nr:PH domain-containing protein [Clostridia bacterium]MDD4376321.1 PH domain-containing protein [Clostridia bacterium]